MKKFICLALLVVLSFSSCLMLSSCDRSEQTQRSSFDYTNDYQYYYNSLNGNSLPITESETGYYFFLSNRFLYYMDKKSLEVTPLCSKVNCIHNSKEECNAYFNTYTVPSTVAGTNVVQFYNNNLYILVRNSDEYGNFEGTSLYKVSLDGVLREKLISFDFGIPAWLIHRGNLYYAKEKYNDNADAAINLDSFSINQLPLDDLNKEPICIFDTSEHFDYIQGVYQFSAYEDYIITSVVPLSEQAIEQYINEGEQELPIHNYYYSICTDTFKVNRIQNQEGEVYFSSFYNGKLLYAIENNESGSNNRYFTSELDGSNPTLLKELKYGDSLFYDGEHMYLCNFIEDFKESKGESIGRKVTLLDSSFNKISTFRLPFSFSAGVPQSPECFICIHTINNTDEEVYYVDKSNLNVLNDEEVEYTTVYSSVGKTITSKNSVSEIDNNITINTDDVELQKIFDSAQQKKYIVSLEYDDSFDANISGGFSVKMHWNGDGGGYTALFQILKFNSDEDASIFVRENPFSIVNEECVAFVSIETVPVEIIDMLSSIIANNPIEPIEISDFTGEMYSFA